MPYQEWTASHSLRVGRCQRPPKSMGGSALTFACKQNHRRERRLISSVRYAWINFLAFESAFSEYILIYDGEIFPFSIFAWMNEGIRSYPCLAALSKNSRKPS